MPHAAPNRVVLTELTVTRTKPRDRAEDDYKIREFAALFPHEPGFEWKKRTRAHELVTQHRETISLLADAWVKQNELSGEDVRRVCGG